MNGARAVALTPVPLFIVSIVSMPHRHTYLFARHMQEHFWGGGLQQIDYVPGVLIQRNYTEFKKKVYSSNLCEW